MYFSRSQLVALAPLLAVLSPVLAQDGGSGGGSGGGDQGGFTQQFTSALQQAGFTQLANVVNQLNGTDSGQRLLSQLSNSGQNFTCFAPTDEALQNMTNSSGGDQNQLANTLSYHFVHGGFLNASTLAPGGGGGGGAGGGGGGGTCTNSGSCTPQSTGTGAGAGGGGGPTTTTTQSAGGGDGGSSTDTATATVTATGSLFKQLFGRQDNSSGSYPPSPPLPPGNGEQPYSGVWPNVTIGRTLLNNSDLVQLEGNKSQVLAWTRSGDQGNITILNQAFNNTSQNITVVNSTSWQNFMINGINGVLIVPGNIQTALQAVNATTALQVLSQAQLPERDGDGTSPAIDRLEDARGITLFVPQNDAFTSQVNQSLQGLQNNQSGLAALLENYYINGTTLYSTQIQEMIAQQGQANATSAGGEPFTFTNNATGLFVSGSNGTSAQIVRPDVLVKNGVIHIVDKAFLNEASDQGAADSAYESASQSAAQVSTTETGPVGGIIGGGGGGGMTQTSTQTQSNTQSSSSSESSSMSSTSQSQASDTSTATATATDTATDTATATVATLLSRVVAASDATALSTSLVGSLFALAASVAGSFVLMV